MVAVIFEVIVEPGERKEEYLSLAAQLKDELKHIKGFVENPGLLNGKMGISIFFYHHGRYTENKILSLSFWEDEDAVKSWRELSVHREAQKRGRQIFTDYRLRVAHVVRDYGMYKREGTPEDSRLYHN